jgi:DNA-binding CsgD family transcriptional regulator
VPDRTPDSPATDVVGGPPVPLDGEESPVPDGAAAVRELSEIAGSARSIPERAQSLLQTVRKVVPFDSAWMALADPLGQRYTSLASLDLDDATVAYLSGPLMAHDIEVTGTNRAGPPLSPSDLPYPAADLRTWAECLIPAGIHEALAFALFGPGGRHVGFVALLSESKTPPVHAVRRRLGRLTSLLAHGVDPMRSLVAAARLVEGASAGVVLRADGGIQPLPGLDDHALLAPDSPVLEAARAGMRECHVYRSFVWPLGGRHAPGGHIRVTALTRTDDVSADLPGMVLLSPVRDLRGLTPRELEVLGLLIEGRSNHEIAKALVVASRTVAAHIEHVLVKLDAPTRTLAAVRAERQGLYVPPIPDPPSGGH